MKHNLFVKEVKTQIGTRRPLFERFSQADENHTLMNREQTLDSIAREVRAILNTRLSGQDQFFEKYPRNENQKGLPASFGLRDIHSMDPSSQSDWLKLQKFCKETIELFEPRLKNIRVRVQKFDLKKQKLFIHMRAHFNVQVFAGPVHFAMDLDCGWIR